MAKARKLISKNVSVADNGQVHRDYIERQLAGRPSIFTDGLAERICFAIASGKTLTAICEPLDMPHRVTVIRWLDDPDKVQFATAYARARVSQADLMDEKIHTVGENSTADSSLSDRVKLSAFQWRAGHLQPSRYGNKVQKEISGPGGGPVKVDVTGLSDAELENLEVMLAKAAGRVPDGGTGGTG